MKKKLFCTVKGIVYFIKRKKKKKLLINIITVKYTYKIYANIYSLFELLLLLLHIFPFLFLFCIIIIFSGRFFRIKEREKFLNHDFHYTFPYFSLSLS